MQCPPATKLYKLASCYEDYAIYRVLPPDYMPSIEQRRAIRFAAYSAAALMLTSSPKCQSETLDHLFSAGFDIETALIIAQAVQHVGRDYLSYGFRPDTTNSYRVDQ